MKSVVLILHRKNKDDCFVSLVLKSMNKSYLVILKQSGNYKTCQVLSFYSCGAEICVSRAPFLLGQIDLGG